tara:strand:+ start:954 stop:2291 length:1338 start_codon:yes stop_codon:yes gene_type:complete
MFTVLFCQDFNIKPKIDYSFYSDGGNFSYDFHQIHSISLGLDVVYKNDKYDIFGSFDNNVLFGILAKPNDFNSLKGQSSFGNHFKKDDIWDYSKTSMKFQYNLNNFKIYLGKFNAKWGNGVYSINFSDKAPSYPQMGFIFDINTNISYEYLHGQLNSLLINEANATLYRNNITSTTRQNNVFRNIVAHKLTYKITDNIIVSGSESVVYANRNFDVHYMPFVAFFTIKDYLGDKDNLQLYADIKFAINDKSYIYSGLFVDEFDPTYILEKNDQNWIVYQLGVNSNDLILEFDNFKIEYDWADHRVYRNKLSVNDYYSHNYPLGLWSGPHSEIFHAQYSFIFSGYDFHLSYEFSKRGELTDSMLELAYHKEYYSRYSNNTEEKEKVSFFIKKTYFKKLELSLGYVFIDWRNAGFDPEYSSIEFRDIIKHSINFNISFVPTIFIRDNF